MAERVEDAVPRFSSQVQDRPEELCRLSMSGDLEDGTQWASENGLEERSNLTAMQLRIWIAQKLSPDTPRYDEVLTFEIVGEIEPRHFQLAFQALIDRCDALRTVIDELDGIPIQRVLPELHYTADLVDLSLQRDPKAAFETWRERRAPVLLHPGKPLFDAALIQLTPQRFIWYLNQHHIITDGWSAALLYRHVIEYYERSLEGRLEAAPTLPSFQGYARQERNQRLLSKQRQAEARRQPIRAEDYKPILFYGGTATRQSFRERRVTYRLGSDKTAALKALLQSEGIRWLNEHTSLLIVFSSLLLVYLYRMCGERRLRIGVPFHNRTEQTKETIGLVMEVFPLEMEIDDDDTFLSLIQKSKVAVWNIFRHTRFGASSYLSPQAYQVILNYPNISFPDFHGLEVDAQWLHTGFGEESRSLFLQILDLNRANDLVLNFDWNEAVLSEDMRCQAGAHFLNVLDQFLANPAQPLQQVTLLTAAERAHLIVELNQTAKVYPDDQTITDLFQAQVRKTPNQVALRFASITLTYAELNARANRLAHHLHTLGVGPEVITAVCLERSPDMVVGLLGILKAGGAFLPLDPSYPKERLSFMLEDAQARLLLTHSRLIGQLPESRATVICLDTDWSAFAEEVNDLEGGATPDNIAYLIYTSGSTGTPKGVLGLHRGIVNRLSWMWENFPFEPGEVCCQKTSLSFVDSICEIFGPLLQGVPTVILSEDMVRDPRRLVQTLAAERVTRIVLVPSLLSAILDTQKQLQSQLSALKLWVTSGEVLSIELHRRFLQSRPGGVLLNLYGSSEVSADATWYDTDRMTEEHATVPIGRPIANTRIYLLDEQMNPVPIGVSGELHVGGVGLARGYLNRPELTSKKFVPDPFSHEPGARLYKTGDLARYLPDGTIEFVGRLDHQIKLHGVRIELGEIEAALERHSAVQRAIVVAREEQPGDKRLVAYVIPRGKIVPTSAELRRLVRDQLPVFMRPSIFVTLGSLPLTPNGKIDLEALPAPDPADLSRTGSLMAPRDKLESRLVLIWEQVLKVHPIGVQDDFFELGGDSLLAARLLVEVEQATGKRLPMVTLLKAPTIERLAQQIRAPTGAVPHASLVPIQPDGSRWPFFFVPGGDGHALGYAKLAPFLGKDQPFYGFEARGWDGIQEPHSDVETMAADYIREMRELQPHGPYFVGGRCIGGIVAYEMARQLSAQGEQVGAVFLFDSRVGVTVQEAAYLRTKTRISTRIYESSLARKIIYPLSRISLHISHLRRLSPRTWKAYLLDKASKAGGVLTGRSLVSHRPPSLPPLPVQTVYLRTISRFRPKPYAGAVYLFANEKWFQRYGNLALGWKNLAQGGLVIDQLFGDHSECMDRYLSDSAAKLKRRLDEAQARVNPRTVDPA